MAKKILVIDDDPVGIALMQGRLAKEGFEVLVEKNGSAGLERSLQEPPDLVILDVEMPEMTGYSFVIEMKKHENLKDTPVIVLTAHEENRAIFARRGITHYLVKPVDLNALFRMFNELMESA